MKNGLNPLRGNADRLMRLKPLEDVVTVVEIGLQSISTIVTTRSTTIWKPGFMYFIIFPCLTPPDNFTRQERSAHHALIEYTVCDEFGCACMGRKTKH